MAQGSFWEAQVGAESEEIRRELEQKPFLECEEYLAAVRRMKMTYRFYP